MYLSNKMAEIRASQQELHHRLRYWRPQHQSSLVNMSPYTPRNLSPPSQQYGQGQRRPFSVPQPQQNPLPAPEDYNKELHRSDSVFSQINQTPWYSGNFNHPGIYHSPSTASTHFPTPFTPRYGRARPLTPLRNHSLTSDPNGTQELPDTEFQAMPGLHENHAGRYLRSKKNDETPSVHLSRYNRQGRVAGQQAYPGREPLFPQDNSQDEVDQWQSSVSISATSTPYIDYTNRHTRNATEYLDSKPSVKVNGATPPATQLEAPGSPLKTRPRFMRRHKEREGHKKQFDGFLFADQDLPGDPGPWEIVRRYPNHLTDEVYRDLIYKAHASANLIYQNLDPRAREQLPAHQPHARFQKVISRIRQEDNTQTMASKNQIKAKAAKRNEISESPAITPAGIHTRNSSSSVSPQVQVQLQPRPQGSSSFTSAAPTGNIPRTHKAGSKRKDRGNDEDECGAEHLQNRNRHENNTAARVGAVAQVSAAAQVGAAARPIKRASAPSKKSDDQNDTSTRAIKRLGALHSGDARDGAAMKNETEKLFINTQPGSHSAKQLPSNKVEGPGVSSATEPSRIHNSSTLIQEKIPDTGSKRKLSDEQDNDGLENSQPIAKRARVETAAKNNSNPDQTTKKSQIDPGDLGSHNSLHVDPIAGQNPQDFAGFSMGKPTQTLANTEIINEIAGNDIELEERLKADFLRFFDYEKYARDHDGYFRTQEPLTDQVAAELSGYQGTKERRAQSPLDRAIPGGDSAGGLVEESRAVGSWKHARELTESVLFKWRDFIS